MNHINHDTHKQRQKIPHQQRLLSPIHNNAKPIIYLLTTNQTQPASYSLTNQSTRMSCTHRSDHRVVPLNQPHELCLLTNLQCWPTYSDRRSVCELTDHCTLSSQSTHSSYEKWDTPFFTHWIFLKLITLLPHNKNQQWIHSQTVPINQPTPTILSFQPHEHDFVIILNWYPRANPQITKSPKLAQANHKKGRVWKQIISSNQIETHELIAYQTILTKQRHELSNHQTNHTTPTKQRTRVASTKSTTLTSCAYHTISRLTDDWH